MSILKSVFNRFILNGGGGGSSSGCAKKISESNISILPACTQVRWKHYQLQYFGNKNHWPEYSMMRDQRKRMVFKNYGRFKLRYQALRKNDILPAELREVADHEVACIPRDAGMYAITRRCVVTSRLRATVFRWRFSRMIFRELADSNKLSGIQRAFWKLSTKEVSYKLCP